MKKHIVRAGIVGLLAATIGGVLVPSVASAVGITDCSVSANNTVIYPASASSFGATGATFTFDTTMSTNLAQGGDYWIWWVGNGTNGTSSSLGLKQTLGTNTWTRSHGQILYDTWTTPTNDVPVSVDVVLTGTGIAYNSGIICQTSVTLMPSAAPSAPTAVSATAGDGQATVSWTPWKTFVGQEYTVTASPGGQTCTATHPATSCDVTGLTNGTAYTFSVTNTTSGGTSAASTASSSVTPVAAATTTTAPALTTTTTTVASGGSDSGSDSTDETTVADEADALPSTGARPVDTARHIAILMIAGLALVGIARRRRLIF